MATLTIRNLDEEIKRQLRIQGAKHNRSMEAEARVILQKTLLTTDANFGLASQIREIVTPYGGVELDLPDRKKDASDKRLTDFQDT
ncbi:MAG: plasmid stabilization protein [SAR324 cluster bacterium]|nr:plasmid stabilization protein [SAR324 cluster bacterium]